MLTKEDIVDQLGRLNIANKVVCFHSSFKSFGDVQGGPQTIIDAFLESGCTLVCPTFFYSAQTYPARINYLNNGIDYESVPEMCSVNYMGATSQIEPSMGVIAKMLLGIEYTTRTKHPTNSFAIAGKDKALLLANQSPFNVYSAYKAIYSENLPALVILAGVDFESCTPIHYAEELAGKSLFRRWAVQNGQVVEVEEGSCSDGFESLRPYVNKIESEIKIGDSLVRVYNFHCLVDTIAEAIVRDPSITHCGIENCHRCNDMVRGGRNKA
ncbi:AAC(3) family N-acetyltransferase [Vibrio chaetopteri]|uniref:Aminoglycoside N(3)-acetyltransferase n=1 Tax=Vibrio chaetopteri TaxID=3016528 RepID=A0AAU8BSB3_9VIBR